MIALPANRPAPARLALARAGGLGAALALAAGGTALAAGSPGAVAPAPARLALPAASAVLACPGPETLLVPDGAQPVPVPGPFSVTAAAAGPAAGSAQLRPLDAAAADPGAGLAAGAGAVAVRVRTGGAAGPQRLTAGGEGTGLAAAQITLARSGDLRGVVAGACPAPVTDAWLVGGGTVPGRRGRLLLANPTPAPAVVDVLLAGPAGPVGAPSARGLVVPPGKVRAVLLDALAPGLDRLAVHVVARTGRVAPLLHDSYLRGATPAGVDDVPVAAAPARRVVVPGLALVQPGPAGAPAAALRLVAPADAEAVVRVHLAGTHGEVDLPGDGVVTVPAGGVLDVPLGGVPADTYAAVAEADVPVAAGAVVVRTGPPTGPLHRTDGDVGWTAATPPLPVGPVGTVAAVPATGVPGSVRLLLSAPGATDVMVRVREVGADGRVLREQPVPVAARTSAAFAVGDRAAALALHADGAVWGALVVEVPDPAGPLVSVLPVGPALAAAPAAPVAVEDPSLGGTP